jgi:4-hydroxy-2-oxoheptanedioate aldolase
MRKSKVLDKIRSGKAAQLAHMGYFMPPFVSFAAAEGYDGIWIDLEHHAMDSRELQALLAFFHKYDLDCMLRPPTREKAQLYRYLEDGVTGLMIPHVGTPDEARDLVQKVKFPPVGDRGIEGLGFETNFGTDIVDSLALSEFVEHANSETFLVLQIETPEGLANVDEIASVPGVDGLFVGPFDLRTRMNCLPPEQRVPFGETMKRVAAACRQHDKAWGSFAMSIEDIHPQLKLGAQILSLGADFLLVREGLARVKRELRDALDER